MTQPEFVDEVAHGEFTGGRSDTFGVAQVNSASASD